jgi:type I restriction enzyme M protein
MLSPKLRSKVYSLWTKFWSAGMTNPLTAIEQITYLIFLKQLEILDRERLEKGQNSLYGSRDFEKKCNLPHAEEDNYDDENKICHGHASCKWSVIREKASPDHLREIVFPWLRELDVTLKHLSKDADALTATRYMEDAFFQLPREKEQTLKAAIETIEELFHDVGSRSANADLMGDIFEYMLERIQTSGQNGQFRTPRQIIRFMIEMLDPKPGSLILDPAAGTAGYLINTIQYLRRKLPQANGIVYEWDGTPHRLPTPTLEQSKQYFSGKHFVAYDNDRTMVRIAWMNMVLHGIDNPQIEQRDALSKSMLDSESGKYDYILANPPYAGNIDKGDLHKDRFPHVKGEPITDKTELLFVWLILDLLKVGGKAAVVVPEGVLFGSTIAHKALRRELLLNHKVEAVVSLPAGVFEPYAGVKTSIIVFEKCEKTRLLTDPPKTEQVWFYEIASDGYSLDKKRTAQPTADNDLWDALYKWQHSIAEDKTYYQPEIAPARWRLVDGETVEIFPALKECQGEVLGIDERFPTLMDGQPLPANPDPATKYIIETQTKALTELYLDYIGAARADAEQAASTKADKPKKRAAAQKAFDDRQRKLEKIFDPWVREKREKDNEDSNKELMLEPEYGQEGGFGRQAFKTCQDAAQAALAEQVKVWVSAISNDETLTDVGKADVSDETWQEKVKNVVRACACLDGYNVNLKVSDPQPRPEALSESKGWTAPVRVWLRDDEWQNEDQSIQGSHDETGNLRPEYVTEMTDSDGSVNSDALDIDCIEANDYNFAASRYKPYELQEIGVDESPEHLINAIRDLESQIQAKGL